MKSTRRRLLAVSTLPLILPWRLRAAEQAPSARITMGFIGMGVQGRGLLGGFLGNPEVSVVAVCDVDANRRNAAKQQVENHYGQNRPAGWSGCEAYNHFAELIARKDIDAVCIATPDHWHAFITVAALRSGKDVYCEKPLTHNIHEAIVVMNAAKEGRRIVQTGSMQRSMGEFRVACELVRNGVLGKISHVHVNFSGPAKPNDLPAEAKEPGLDWDLWLGPAPVAEYSSVLSPRGVHGHYPAWREYAEYGGGGMTDFGAHHLDIAHWGLGMDGSGPEEARPSPQAAELFAGKKPGEIRGTELTYPGGVVVKQVSGYGVEFFGSEGVVRVDRGRFELTLKEKVVAKKSGDADRVSVESQYMRAEKDLLGDAKVRLAKSGNHLADFIAAVRSRQAPVSDETAGGCTAIGCHLMAMANRTGKTVRWDPVKRQLVGDAIDAKELSRAYRGDYRV
jgi:predicted dehydrogenase